LIAGLGALKELIPQIKYFSYGPNNSPEGLNRGCNFGFVMEFDNVEARQIYLDHPAHIYYANEKILPNLVDGVNSPVVFDYDI